MPELEPFRDERWTNVYAHAKLVKPSDVGQDDGLPEGFWVGCTELLIEVQYLGESLVARHYLDPRIDSPFYFAYQFERMIENIDEMFKEINPLIHALVGCSKKPVELMTRHRSLVTCPRCKERLTNAEPYRRSL